MDKITTFEQRFVDGDGRERIFLGVNVVDKDDHKPGEQFYPIINEDVIKKFSQLGFNIIRLGFTWAKIEPQPGCYNDEYLDSVAAVLDYCEKYGIYVFLDMHQDLYSVTTNGDGAPKWAVQLDGIKVKPMRFVWAEGYFWGKACHRAFDNFWANKAVNGKGLQEYYAECWQHIVEKLGDKPAVIGFDMMNEPFMGSDGGKVFRRLIKSVAKVVLFDKDVNRKKLVKDALSKDRVEKVLGHISYNILHKATSPCDELVAKFDTKAYAPFLSRISEAVRKKNSDKILFSEACYYSNLGIPHAAPRITVNGKQEKHQVFSPHAYDFMVDTAIYKFASNDRVGGIFDEHRKTQQRLDVPVLVGEWGGFGGDDEDWLPHIEFLLNIFDKYKWSSSYWCYYHEDFFTSPLMKVLVRPYPEAVAGEIENYSYNRGAKTFTLTFSQKDENGQHVIKVPFGAAEVLLDGSPVEYRVEGVNLYIDTAAGNHTLTVKF